MRVLTVTGSATAATTRRAIATIAAGSRSQPAPAPRPAICGTQQPQLMSMNAGAASAATSAACISRVGVGAVDLDGGGPVVGGEGRPCGGRCCSRGAMSRSALTNSVTQRSAPRPRQSRRKTASVTSSIGARTTGEAARSAATVVTEAAVWHVLLE